MSVAGAGGDGAGRVAAVVAGAAAGSLLGVAAGALPAARGIALGPRLLLASVVGAGVALLADAVTGGRHGRALADATWGNRYKAGFALRNLHRPGVVLAARAAHDDARTMQQRRFGPQRHADDAIDAVRHAYASGLLASRLMQGHAMSAEAALAIVDDVGRAHERDADPEDQHRLSSAMDLHNNGVGARIGTRLAAAGPADERLLLDEVVRAAASGELVVVDADALRPTRPAELPPPR